jgi:cytochrome b561
MKNSKKYTGVAIAFHWVLAALIIGSFCFAVYMVDLPFSPARIKQYNWHKWAGITILLLSALRLLWRLTHQPPAHPLNVPVWQNTAATLAHWLLYILFFAIPLMGWAYSSAAGFTVVYFGVIPLPDWVNPDPELAKFLKMMHRYLAYSLAALVFIHIAAAVKHQWINRDGLLLRMMPGRHK